MRYHCNRCNKDFTTLSDDKGKKFAFSHFQLEKMSCPHCGATNRSNIPKRPLKQTRGRWQPKRRSMDTDDYSPPSIVLHPICQKRIIGSISSIEGIRVECEGCPSAFNCLTGNVDDGTITESAFEIQEAKDRAKAKAVEDAKIKAVENKVNEDKLYLKQLRDKLGNLNFCYVFQNNLCYARFGGTVWKLDRDDEKAILEQTWHTPKTIVIKNTFLKREIKPIMAQKLLYWEYTCLRA